jgi:predicted RNA-binding Zn-ribbon protein involved in translation (DUF1610 family)
MGDIKNIDEGPQWGANENRSSFDQVKLHNKEEVTKSALCPNCYEGWIINDNGFFRCKICRKTVRIENED